MKLYFTYYIECVIITASRKILTYFPSFCTKLLKSGMFYTESPCQFGLATFPVFKPVEPMAAILGDRGSASFCQLHCELSEMKIDVVHY